jgi:RHS repeat-associated protein
LTDFVYDGLTPVKEAVGATTVNLLTGLGIDEYLTRTSGGTTEYFLSEALGSTVALADGSGALATEYSYAPFGTATASGTSSSSNELQYTGREGDGTGLHYYRARYYHPGLQRFLSEDPIRFGGGDANLYPYVGNAPLNYIDPSGLDIAVIENGPTQGNPIGHTAVAITGHGVYSFGNDVELGSSLAAYLLREAPRRNTVVYVIKTDSKQDAAALAYLTQGLPQPLGKIWDNCSSRSNAALDAAGITRLIADPRISAMLGNGIPMQGLTNQPGTAGLRAATAGAVSSQIPKGSTLVPLDLQPFEPRK